MNPTAVPRNSDYENIMETLREKIGEITRPYSMEIVTSCLMSISINQIARAGITKDQFIDAMSSTYDMVKQHLDDEGDK